MEDWKLKNITPGFGKIYAVQKDGNYVLASDPSNTRFYLYKNIGNSTTKRYIKYLDELTSFKIGEFSSAWIENNFLYYVNTANYNPITKIDLTTKAFVTNIYFSNTISCDFIALKVKNNRVFTLHKETGNSNSIFKEHLMNNNGSYTSGNTVFPVDIKDFDVQYADNTFSLAIIYNDSNNTILNFYKSSGNSYQLKFIDTGKKITSTKLFYNAVSISEKGDEIITGCILSSYSGGDLYLSYYIAKGFIPSFSYPSSLNKIFGNVLGNSDKIVEVEFLLDSSTICANDGSRCYIYAKNSNTNVWEPKGDYFTSVKIFPFITLNDLNFFKETGGYYEFRITEYPFDKVNWSKHSTLNESVIRGTSTGDCFGKNIAISPDSSLLAVFSNGKIGDISIYKLEKIPYQSTLEYRFVYRFTGVLDHSFGFLDNNRLFFMDSNYNLKITSSSNINTVNYSLSFTSISKAVSYGNTIFVYRVDDQLFEKIKIIDLSNGIDSLDTNLFHSMSNSYKFSSLVVNSKTLTISYISSNSNEPNLYYTYSYIGFSFTQLNSFTLPYDLVGSFYLASDEDILYIVNRKNLNVYTLVNSDWTFKTSINLYQDNRPFIKLSLSSLNDGSIIAIGDGEKVRLYRFDGTNLTVYGNEILGDYIEDGFGSSICFIKNSEDLIVGSPTNSSNYYSSGKITFYTSNPLISLIENKNYPQVYNPGEYFYLNTFTPFTDGNRIIYKRSSKNTWEIVTSISNYDIPSTSNGLGIYLGNGSPSRFNLNSNSFYLDLDSKNFYYLGTLITNNNFVNVIRGDVPVHLYPSNLKPFVNGDYYIDRKRGDLYGPYTDFSWKNSKVFTLPDSFKSDNYFLAVTQNFDLSSNLDQFNFYPIVIIDTANNIIYGPTVSDINILPRKVIIKDYVKPTKSIGFVGEYLYSSSLRKLYGPKTENSWPDNNITLPFIIDLESNVEMYVGSDSIKPSKLVSTDNIFIDLFNNSIYEGADKLILKIFRRVLVGAGIPSNSIGIAGDYFIDQMTCQIYGPKSDFNGWGPIILGYWPDFKLLNLPIYITESLIETSFINHPSFCIINLSTNMIYIRQFDKNKRIELSSISTTRHPTTITGPDYNAYTNPSYKNPFLIHNSALTRIIFHDRARNKTNIFNFPLSLGLNSDNVICYLNTNKMYNFQGPNNGEGKNNDYYFEYIPFSNQYTLIGPKINDRWIFDHTLTTPQSEFITLTSNIVFNPLKYYIDPVTYNIICPTYDRSTEVISVKFPKFYDISTVYITNSIPTPQTHFNLTYFTKDAKFYIRQNLTTDVYALPAIEKAIVVDKIESLSQYRYAFTIHDNKLYSKGNQTFITNIHKLYDFTGDVIVSTSDNLTFLNQNILKKDIVYCTDDDTFYYFANPNSPNLIGMPSPAKAYINNFNPPGFNPNSEYPIYILQNSTDNKWDLFERTGNNLVKLNRNVINYQFTPFSNVYVVKNNKIDLTEFESTDIVLFYDVRSYYSTLSNYNISFLQIPDTNMKITPYANSPVFASLVKYDKFIFDDVDLINIKNVKIKNIEGNYFIVSVMYEDDRFNFVQLFFFDESMNYLCRIGDKIRPVISLPVGNKPKDKVKDFLKRTPKERQSDEKKIRKVTNTVFNFFTEVIEDVTPDFIEDKISSILKPLGVSKETFKNFITENIVNGAKLIDKGFESISNFIFDLDEGGEGSFGEDTYYLEKYDLLYIGAPTSYLDKRGTVRLVQTDNKTLTWFEGNRQIGRFGTSIAVGGVHGEVLAIGQPGVFTSNVVGMVKVYEKNSDNIFGYRKQNKGFAVMSIVKNTLRAAATGALIGLAVSGIILPILSLLGGPLGFIGVILFTLIGAAIASVVSITGELWEGSYDEWSTVEGEGILFHTGSNLVISNDGETLIASEIRRPAQMNDSIMEKSGREKAYDFLTLFGETISVTQQLSNLFSPKEASIVETGIKTSKQTTTAGSTAVKVVNYANYLKRAQVYKKILLSSGKEIGKVALSSVDKVALLKSSVENTKFLKIKNLIAKASKGATAVGFVVSVLFLGDSIASAVSFGKLIDRIDKDLDADKFSSINLYSRTDEWRPSRKLTDNTLKNTVNEYVRKSPYKTSTSDERTVLENAKSDPEIYKYSPALFTGKSMFGYGSSVGISGDGNTVAVIDKIYINDSPKNLIQRATSIFSEDESDSITQTFTDYKIIIYQRKFDLIKNFYYWVENTVQIEEKILNEEPLKDYNQTVKLSFNGKYLAVGSPLYSQGNQVLQGRIVVYQISGFYPIKLFSIEGISEYQLIGQNISFETTSNDTSLIISEFDEDINTDGLFIKYNKFILNSQ